MQSLSDTLYVLGKTALEITYALGFLMCLCIVGLYLAGIIV